MIRNVVEAIEQNFRDEWMGEINYDQVNYVPVGDKWIELSIVPIISEYSGTTCTIQHYQIHVLAYSKNNKVESGELSDSAIAFLQNTKIGDINITNWRTIGNGLLDDGTYFYKLIFESNKLTG